MKNLLEEDLSLEVEKFEQDLQNNQTSETKENIYGQEIEELILQLEKANKKIISLKEKITQYKNERDETVPFFRVGEFIVIQEKCLNETNRAIREYPYLIVLEVDNFDIGFDYYHTYSWGGYTIGVLASMLANADKIRGLSFIDFGAGRTGIFAIAAKMLGAAEIILVERDLDMIDQLKNNLRENKLQNYILHEKAIQEVNSIETKYKVIFALNLPCFGTGTGRGEKSDELETALDILKNPLLLWK